MIVATERIEILEIPLRKIRRFAGQPRKKFNQARLEALARSIGRKGQLVPGMVRRLRENPRHDWELIDGERRYLACGLAGLQTFRAYPQRVVNEADQFEASLASNFGREAHSPLEVANAITRLRGAGRTLQDIADLCSKSLSWVTRHAKLSQLSPAVAELLEPDDEDGPKLGLSAAVLIADLPIADQLKVARKVIEGGFGVFAVAREVRKVATARGLRIARARKGSDDWPVIRGMIARVGRELVTLMEMQDDELRRVFAGRTPNELHRFAELPESVAGDFSMFCDKLARLCRQEQTARRRAAARAAG